MKKIIYIFLCMLIFSLSYAENNKVISKSQLSWGKYLFVSGLIIVYDGLSTTKEKHWRIADYYINKIGRVIPIYEEYYIDKQKNPGIAFTGMCFMLFGEYMIMDYNNKTQEIKIVKSLKF